MPAGRAGTGAAARESAPRNEDSPQGRGVRACTPAPGGAAGRGGWSWVVGCDLMYIEEAVPSLVDTLLDCTGGADTPDPQVRVLFAFGRNSQAQHAFEAEMRAHRFTQHRLSARELHPDYAPLDVKVFEWRRLARPARNRSRVG